MGIGLSFVFISLPPIGRKIGISETDVGIIITMGALIFVIFSFLWGPWINRLGLRRTIKVGMLIYAITTTLLGLVLQLGLNSQLSEQSTFYLAIVLRMMFCAGVSGVAPACQAYLIATSTAQTRTVAISNMSVAVSAGMILGPVLAALSITWGLVTPFFIIAVLCLLSVLFLGNVMPTMKSKQSKGNQHKMVWHKHPVLPLFLLSGLAVFCVTGLQQTIVFYVQDMLKLETTRATQLSGIAMATMTTTIILFQLFVIRRVSWSPSKMIYIGSALWIVAMLDLLLNYSYFGVIFGLILFGMGTSFLFPAIVSKQSLVSKSVEQGSVAGANTSAQGIGMTLSPVLYASLYQINYFLPFLMIGFVAFLIVAIHRYIKDGINLNIN